MLSVTVDKMTTIFCHIAKSVSVSQLFASNFSTFTKVWYDHLLAIN